VDPGGGSRPPPGHHREIRADMTTHLDPSALDDGGLGTHSVDVLIGGQDGSGAFLASPTFPIYRFAWLRDGSFCARALDAVGRSDRAALFHQWVQRTVLAHRDRADAAIAELTAGQMPAPEDILPARFVVDGRREVPGEVLGEVWPNYQLDGYGTWLFELAAHQRIAAAEPATAGVDRTAVAVVADYLAAAWRTDCYDCWEEFGDGKHAATYAAVAAGLMAAAELLDERRYADVADEVRTLLHTTFVRDGRLCKGDKDDRVDASLLWCTVPFGLIEPSDPIMHATAEAVRTDLRGRTGGIYRYVGDTYYGGGEWILLTAWLGWYDAITGNTDGVAAARTWIRSAATATLELPEQTINGVQDPDMVDSWVKRWGPVATPLLWSHAMYLIMSAAPTSV
jgi:GH15 family glucan-1,4-alpha-glucosidase